MKKDNGVKKFILQVNYKTVCKYLQELHLNLLNVKVWVYRLDLIVNAVTSKISAKICV